MRLTLGNTYCLIRSITPPFIFDVIRNSRIYPRVVKIARKVLKQDAKASWNTVKKGQLKGTELYLYPAGNWQKEMLEGTYDDFFFSLFVYHDAGETEPYDYSCWAYVSSRCGYIAVCRVRIYTE